MRKRITAGLLTPLSLLLVVCFCPKVIAEESGKEIKVVTSFYPLYITAINVIDHVPGVSIDNLTEPSTGCLHDYILTTQDMKKIADAQIFIANGAGMESFLEKVASQYPHLKIIKLSQGIPLINGQDGVNPHVWVSISNAIEQVKNLGKAMESLDPEHGEYYRINTDKYSKKLDDVRKMMHLALKPYIGKKIITFHEAFPYFAREFGLEIAAVIEREPGSQPSARELARTVELVKKSGIKTLFAEPQYPVSVAEAIAKETGAKVYLLDPAVTGPMTRDAYMDIMIKNLEILKEAFEQN